MITYKPQLDGLRGLAVAAVLYTHYLPSSLHLWNVYWGDLGVRLFFVLSGFLITEQLLAARARQASSTSAGPGAVFKRFYSARVLRLMPPFLIVLCAASLLGVEHARDNFLWHALALSNVRMALGDSWLGALAPWWSLSVEWQFYLLWPLLVLTLPRRALLMLSVLCVPAAIGYRLWADAIGLPFIATAVLPPYSIDALGAGAVLAALGADRRARWAGSLWAIVCAGGAFALFVAISNGMVSGVGAKALAPTLMVWPFVVLIARASLDVPDVWGRLSSRPALVWLGALSYTVYLVHTIVLAACQQLIAGAGLAPVTETLVGAALAVVISLGIASLSWYGLERPLRRLRRRLAARHADPDVRAQRTARRRATISAKQPIAIAMPAASTATSRHDAERPGR